MIRDLLPLLEGWEPKIIQRSNIDVARRRYTVLDVMDERGWVIGGTLTANNKYLTLTFETRTTSFSLSIAQVHRAGYVSPLKPGWKPYVTVWSEDSPGSETGTFTLDLDMDDWLPIRGRLTIQLHLPNRVVMPDGTVETVSSTSARVSYFVLTYVRVTDLRLFRRSLAEILSARPA